MKPRQSLPCALSLLAVVVVGGTSAHAQTSILSDKAVKIVNLDLTVPDSPAFAILGLAPEKVVRPSAPKDLATTLLNGVDQHGNLQSGVAVDFAPLFLFAGNGLSYRDYHDHAGKQIAGRTQISLATTKGSSDADKSVRAAFGLRSTFWDKGDPRLDDDLVKCLDAIDVPVPTVALITQAQKDAWEAEQSKALRPKVGACQTASAKRNWNASSFAAGVAPAFQSPTGDSSDFKYAGAAVWGALALKLSSANNSLGQLIVQGRYRNKEQVPDKNNKGKFFEQDSGGLGLRLVLGEAVRAFVVESEIGRQSPKNGEAATSFTLSGGGQLKLSDELWLSLSIGGALKGSEAAEHGMFVLSSFKWALSKAPAIPAQ